ncbi:internal core protein [Pseudomonas phage vB_PaeP_PPA-ABTNL]|uniref:Internal core protein n=1 Tax=Pseudomonas phage vB_PaeP_PPA-ABTNL TaxID=1527525 RepID=A0A0B4N6C2_9CAUD|nr:internal virion protein with endolysin domain [Pseudomonas phage vB_PaeP_PPA-ABTNL]AIK67604.1 internal core protein [Pseudomonas phage vB_PaeP_PPA-ABTNL]
MAKQFKGRMTPKYPLDQAQLDEAQVQGQLDAVPTVGFDALTGGEIGERNVAAGQRANARELERIVADQELPALDRASALWNQSTLVGRWGDALQLDADLAANSTGEVDPNFDAGTYGVQALQAAGIQPTDNYLQIMARAGNAEDAAYLLSRIQRYEQDEQIVRDNPYWNFAAGMLDPAALAVDAVTFGAGRALRLGRAGMAAAGGAGQVGYVAGLDAAGADVDAGTYIVAGALGAGVGALLGSGAGRIAAEAPTLPQKPEVSAPTVGLPEVAMTAEEAAARGFKAGDVVDLLDEGTVLSRVSAKVEQAEIPAIPRRDTAFGDELHSLSGRKLSEVLDHLKTHAEVPKPLQGIAAKVADTIRTLEGLGQRTAFRVVQGGDTASSAFLKPGTAGIHSTQGLDTLVQVRGSTAPGRVGTNPVTVLHEAVHAATVGVMNAALRNPGAMSPKVAQAMQTLENVRGNVLNALKQDRAAGRQLSEFEETLLAGNSNTLANVKELVAWGLTDTRFQRTLNRLRYSDGGPGLWSRFVEGIRTLLGLRSDADTALSRVLAASETIMEAMPGYTKAQAKWANKGAPVTEEASLETIVRTTRERAREGAGFVNRFFSEADLLAQPGEGARRLLSRLIDDPVRRDGFSTNDNAASYLRRYRNEFEGYVKSYDEMMAKAMAEQGVGLTARALNSRRAMAVRDQLNEQVTRELLRRDREWTAYGSVRVDPNLPPTIKALADRSDEIHGLMGQRAREAGVRGFEDFAPRPGYFHRSWNWSKMAQMDEAAPGLARRAISEAVFRGIPGLERADADTIAQAIVQRARDRATGIRSEFMGAMGVADTAFIRQALEEANVSQAKFDSIMAKIEQKQSDQGTVKYGKGRLSLDMTAEINHNGTVYRVQDLIDRDLDRLMENYAGSMSGRSALARAGMPGDSEIEAFIREYQREAAHLGTDKVQELTGQLRGVFGDFTGNVPREHQLGPVAQRASGLTSATMLGFSGVYQLAELATMAHRQGVFNVMKAMLNSRLGDFVGAMRRDPDLADEMQTVLGLNLANDIRMKPWKRQFDTFLASQDTFMDRFLHAGKQAVPVLNGMKFIHNWQSRMNANLTLNKVARAAQGDEAALRVLQQYGKDVDWTPVLARVRGYVTYRGRNAQSMNWGAWSQADVNTVMNTALRIMDDSLLYGRVGQNSGFARSPVGQILGQFRSFVAFAHNKLLRGTYENSGVLGVASLLAFQYPLTALMMGAKAAINGKFDTSDEGIRKMAIDGIGYTAGLGFTADMWGVVTGHSRMSAPVFGLAEHSNEVFRGVRDLVTGDDPAAATGDIVNGAAGALPFVNVFPATKLLLESIKGE